MGRSFEPDIFLHGVNSDNEASGRERKKKAFSRQKREAAPNLDYSRCLLVYWSLLDANYALHSVSVHNGRHTLLLRSPPSAAGSRAPGGRTHP